MQKKKLIFIKAELRDADSGDLWYNLFTTEEGKQLAIRKNNVTSYMGNLISGEEYTLFLDYNACQGIKHKDKMIFNWAGRVIMKNKNNFFELNTSRTKKILSETQLALYHSRFYEINGFELD